MLPRNVPLAERRQDARALEAGMKRHLAGGCPSCGKSKCTEYRMMQRELMQVRDEIRHWFDPAPGTPALF